jgi:carbamoyl-phosphate synthase large subunit
VNVLVTGAGGPLGVNVCRSLRKAPGAPRLIGTDANRWHLPLSLADATYLIPPARDGAAYATALAALAARERIDVIVPTHPVEVRAVATLRDRGGLGGMAVCLPATGVIETCDDKARTQAALAAVGVPVPRTIALGAAADVARAFAELAGEAGTVWVRGSGAPGLGIGAAALPCRDVGVATAWVEHHRGWGRMSASEYLPGANLTWMAAFDRGTLLAAASRERLEYVLPHVAPSGVTGAPAVTRTLHREDVSRAGEAAVRAVDPTPHGVYFVDLKEDAGGVARVTEINAGRCGTTIQFYTEAGFNFPWLLCRLASGEAVAPLPDPHRAVELDLYWVRTLDCGPVLVRGDAGFDGYPAVGG